MLEFSGKMEALCTFSATYKMMTNLCSMKSLEVSDIALVSKIGVWFSTSHLSAIVYFMYKRHFLQNYPKNTDEKRITLELLLSAYSKQFQKHEICYHYCNDMAYKKRNFIIII